MIYNPNGYWALSPLTLERMWDSDRQKSKNPEGNADYVSLNEEKEPGILNHHTGSILKKAEGVNIVDLK